MITKEEVLRLIESRVETMDPGACWHWTAGNAATYGTVWWKYRTWRATRLVAAAFHGLDLMNPKTFACHRCDNPPCVNPDHLFVGTQDANMKDARKKGRMRIADRHGMAQLSRDQVVSAFERYNSGEEMASIATEFGVHIESIRTLLRGATYPTITKGLVRTRRGPTQRRPVVCVETGQRFASSGEAARVLGLWDAAIRSVCHGKLKSTGGRTFRFI